ncbi:MAG: hypothetical protein PHV34_11250 [Verrucomicrobiae bacterium]|nr:hypothetical protein [Verrucomicrobiae bacterium]
MSLAKPVLKIKLGYLPLAKASWLDDRVETARQQAESFLRGFDVELISSGKTVVADDEARDCAARFAAQQVDVLLVHFITFSLGSIIPILISRMRAPMILWGVPEPVMDGGRLKANSFCALNMNCHTLWKMERPCAHLFGSEADIRKPLQSQLAAIACMKNLRESRLGLVGNRVPGFYASNFNELALRSQFGVEVKHIDLAELFEVAGRQLTACPSDLAMEVKACAGAVKGPTDQELGKAGALYRGLIAIAQKRELDGFAVKCWPEFGDFFGVAVCATLGMLNDAGFPTACEGDVYGAVSMLMAAHLAGSAPFFMDMVAANPADNTCVFWHCGAVPASLCRQPGCGVLRHHGIMDGGDRKGVTNDFPVKEGPVTILRLGEGRHGHRLLIASGEGLPTDCIIRGNPLRVKMKCPVDDFTRVILDQGFEHHYTLVHGWIGDEAQNLCKWLDIESVIP